MSRTIHMIGNWKMNKDLESIKDFFNNFSKIDNASKVEKWIAPQALHLGIVNKLGQEAGIKTGSQNCANNTSGAFTGEISSAAIKDFGAHFTLIGHSERRAIYKENNKIINEKVKLAIENNLTIVFCVGETLEERESGKTNEVLEEQLVQGLDGVEQSDTKNIIIAYEPVWAIGTGKTATPEMAQETHACVRAIIGERLPFTAQDTIILYGGSVKPSNVDGLLEQPDIDGGLVGGASLEGDSFLKLCQSAEKYC